MGLRIAIMGIRGIPANYGGFETFVEALSTRLVKKGHHVTVYCRSNSILYPERVYMGVELVLLPTVRHKYFDTVAHTFLSVFHCLRRKYDVILICNSVNSIFSFVPRIVGTRVAVNVDGLEWQRSKWNIFGKWVYRISEYFSTILPNQVVTDSRFIQAYYRKRFRKNSVYIPYGSPTGRVNTDSILKEYSLKSRRYVLYVSRLEPENNAHLVIKAFERTRTDMQLVVVGDAPYNEEYIRGLKRTKDTRILFTGYVFGHGYRELQSNAYLYIQATEVGGTHPALLEGMGYGNCILANDVPEHREVLGDSGRYFTTRLSDDLAEELQYLLDHSDEVARLREKASARAGKKYSWKKVTADYESLFKKMM